MRKKQNRLTLVTLFSSVSSLTYTAPTAGLTGYCITATLAHTGTAYAPKTCLTHYTEDVYYSVEFI